MLQVADQLEGHFMARMPPSRRSGKFAPVILPGMGEKTAIYFPAAMHANSCTSSSVTSSTDIGKPTNEGSGHEGIGSSEQNKREGIERMTAQSQDTSPSPGSVATGVDRISTSTTASVPKLDNIQDNMPNPEDIRRFGEKKAKKIATGKLAIEDGREYDMQLWKAVFKTIQFPWLLASSLESIGSESAFLSTIRHIDVL